MKRLFLLFFPLASLSVRGQENTFVLEGKLGNWNKPVVLILSYVNDGARVTDTSDLENGIFRLTGKISRPVLGSMTLWRGSANHETRGRLWIEPAHILVNSSDSLKNAVITGSLLNEEQQSLDKALDSLMGGRKQEVAGQFIRSHPHSLVSLMTLYYLFGNTKNGEIPDAYTLEPLFNGLSAAIRESSPGRQYQAKIKEWKASRVGLAAPDFTQPDQNGMTVKLSDFRGKYVLLDFWASWCHPCREENPNLVQQYHLYKDKNFCILGVSMDGTIVTETPEQARTSWLKAIKEDGVAWTQVSDLKGTRNEAVVLYGVQAIPDNFLIDPQGKIIGRGLRGKDLAIKLKGLLEKESLP